LNGQVRPLTLGFDIGSTGSKVVALDLKTGETLWEGYRRTNGAPVEAAQAVLEGVRDLARRHGIAFVVSGCATTGSGRKLVQAVIGADAAIGENFQQQRMRQAAIDEVDLAYAGIQSIHRTADFRDHAAGNGAIGDHGISSGAGHGFD
jgi:activator of 2-hydroxyglutaryl-CoA dehydratase